jgi:hypothetical protein
MTKNYPDIYRPSSCVRLVFGLTFTVYMLILMWVGRQ